ncbi:MAG: hypothetical protein ACQESR_10085 [Planctomycetota bacterium]
MWSRSHGRPERIDAMTEDSADTIYPKLLQEAGYRNGFFGKALRFDGSAFLPAGKLPPLERDADFT